MAARVSDLVSPWRADVLHILLLLLAVRRLHAGASDSISQKLSQRKIAQMNGQIIIGGLFPIHEQPTIKSAFTRECGRVREQYGMHRVEVFMKTIREINERGVILPNITLGLDIRDTCWYPPVALEQSIDFIRNSLAHLDRSTRAASSNASTVNLDGSFANEKDCGRVIGKPIASLIGPGSSSVTIQVQNLLQLFKIPQIGYSATSMDLSKKDEYRYFLRVVPPDNLQAQVLVDIVVRYKWKYLSLLHSKGNYGSRGIKEFKKYLENTDVCTDQELDIDNKEELSTFEKIAHSLFKHSNPARVVICFCQGETVRKLYTAMKRLNITKEGYLIVGSDGWADRPDVLGKMVNSKTQKREMSEDVVGGISIRLHSPKVPGFDEYFWSLKPRKNNPNPWFNEFWEQKFACSFTKTGKNIRRCTGNESLNTSDYRQDTKLGFVVNSVYSVAYGLSSMQKEVCGDTVGICKGFLPVNGSLLLQHLLNVSFTTYSGEKLQFDSKGDPPGRYDIMNYRSWENKTTGELRYDYVQVGSWQQGALSMQDHLIMWPKLNNRVIGRVTSICSPPCRPGEIKVISIEKKKCCWKCKMCKDDEFIEYVESEERCSPCGAGKRPGKDRTGCVLIEVEYMKWSDTQAIVSMVFACFGILLTLAVLLVIARHNHTPVVKASTRELIYFILAGVILSYCTTFVLVAKPSIVTCYLSRILPGISFSLIYGALVTKTNRIARILAGSKKKIMTRKPRFLSTTAQIVICCLINAVECSIIVAMLIVEPADATKDYSIINRVKLICNTTSRGVIVPLGFDILLICLCTVYAIRTRNLPENFNEAKFIGFTMYTTCVVWIGFVSIYFGSDNKVMAMCLTMSLSASVALVLLFFPKVYIILCKPEKNQRSAFTTSKDIRCHIGPGRLSSKSTDQSKGFESAALTVYRQKNYFDRWKRQSSRGDSRCSSEENHRPAGSGRSVDADSRHSARSALQASCRAAAAVVAVAAPGPDRLFHDSWAQTDDDLVTSWLRRRRRSSRRGGDATCASCRAKVPSPSSSERGASREPPAILECDADDEEPGPSSDDDDVDGVAPNGLGSVQTETQPLIHSAMPPPIDWRQDAGHSLLAVASSPSTPPHGGRASPMAMPKAETSPCLSRRRSSSSSSSSGLPAPERLSIEDLSVLGLRLLDEEETSTQRFSSYMKEHGVEFDLDTIQTSEV